MYLPKLDTTFHLRRMQGRSRYWKMELPAGHCSDIDGMFQTLKLDPFTCEPNCRVVGVKGQLHLQTLEGQCINLHALNDLFEVLQEMDERTLDLYDAVLSTGQWGSLPKMQTLTQNLDCYWAGAPDGHAVLEVADTPYGPLCKVCEPDMTRRIPAKPPAYHSYFTPLIQGDIASKADPEKRYPISLPNSCSNLNRAMRYYLGCERAEDCTITLRTHRLKEEEMEKVKHMELGDANWYLRRYQWTKPEPLDRWAVVSTEEPPQAKQTGNDPQMA